MGWAWKGEGELGEALGRIWKGLAAVCLIVVVGLGLEIVGSIWFLLLAYVYLLSAFPAVLSAMETRWRRGLLWACLLAILGTLAWGGVLFVMNLGEEGVLAGPMFGLGVGLFWAMIPIYAFLVLSAGPMAGRAGDPRVRWLAWGAAMLGLGILVLQGVTIAVPILGDLLQALDLWMLVIPTGLLAYAAWLAAEQVPGRSSSSP